MMVTELNFLNSNPVSGSPVAEAAGQDDSEMIPEAIQHLLMKAWCHQVQDVVDPNKDRLGFRVFGTSTTVPPNFGKPPCSPAGRVEGFSSSVQGISIEFPVPPPHKVTTTFIVTVSSTSKQIMDSHVFSCPKIYPRNLAGKTPGTFFSSP